MKHLKLTNTGLTVRRSVRTYEGFPQDKRYLESWIRDEDVWRSSPDSTPLNSLHLKFLRVAWGPGWRNPPPLALQLQLLHMSSSRVLTQLAHIVGIPADTRCSLVPSCRKEMPILKLRNDDNNRGSRICKCCAAFTLKCFGEFHQRVMMRGFAPKAEKLDRTGTSNWMWKWSQRRRFTFSLSVEESFSLNSKFDYKTCYYREL